MVKWELKQVQCSLKKIAACTTSIGRQRIYDAKNDAASGVKEWALENGYKPPSVVYGDTDSVFVKFSKRNSKMKMVMGKSSW